jgi:lysyl-tRNA synthetase class I
MAIKQEMAVSVTGKTSASTAWTPRTVRCAHCGELAREEVRERVSEEEVAVRYGCTHCRWQQTRHYHENEA